MDSGRTQSTPPATDARERARVVAGILCLVPLTVGLLALLDRGSELAPIAAVAIVAVALGAGSGLATGWARRVGRILLAAAALFSLAQLLREGAEPGPGVDPGRMAAFDAFVLLLAASGNLLGGLRTAWCSFVGQVASLLALLLSVHVLFGHVLGLVPFYAPLDERPTAVGTALALGSLAFSSLYVNFDGKIAGVFTDEGPSARLLRIRLSVLLLAVLLLGGAAAAALQTGAMESAFTLALLSAGSGALLVGFVAWLAFDLRASDRRLAEATESLAASERMFRGSFENAFVGMAHLDASRRCVRVNPRLCDLLGHDSQAMLRRSLRDLLDPADLASLEEPLRELQEGRSEAFTGEHRWIARGGERKWFALHATARRSASGEFRHFILVLLDVTEAKRAAEWLRIQARSLEAAASGIVITENRRSDHPIVYVNPAFERLTGYSREEVLGKNCRFLNRLAREQPELEPLRRALREGQPCTVVLRNHAKDGTPFWNELSLSPVVDEHGVVTHTIGIQNDITKHLELAAEAEESLREALDERGRALAAARARDVLLATVSHELRSPLNSIRLWASLLHPDARADAAMIAKSVHHIESSVETQNRLIDDLLDVSRIASGHLELDLEPIELGALSADVVAELRPAAEEKGLRIEDRFVDRGVVVRGDRTRLMQVLRNLVENAIKFTPRGGTVVVEGGGRGTEAEIRVSDDGVGMEPDAIPRIFDQFWKANGRNGGRQGGLGLGLSIVKLVVERHGGTVSAVSEGSGCGATLIVRLPLPQAQRTPIGSDGPVPHEMPARGGYVLVVDDEIGTAEALALALGVRGLEVHTAYDADSAMERILERRPQILLSDLVLPGASGFDLMRRVRAQEEEGLVSRVHAIAISGRGNPADRSNVRRAGFDDFLSKPLSVQTVFRKIEEALARPVG